MATADVAPRRRARFARIALRSGWAVLEPLLVVAAIGALPLLAAGLSLIAACKVLVALPAAVAIVYGTTHRRLAGWGTFVGYFALMAALVAGGVPQGDVLCDTSALSMFAVAAWLAGPRFVALRGRPVALPVPDVRAGLLRGWRRLDAAPAALARDWRIAPRTARALLGSIVVTAAGVAIVSFVGRFEAPLPLRAASAIADAALGGAAMWFVGRRFGGRTAGIGAAALWICCGQRFAYATLPGDLVLPTCVVPILAAAAPALRENGRLRRGLWPVLAIVMLALSFFLPTLTFTAWAVLIVTFASAGFRRDALLAIAGSLVTTLLIFTVLRATSFAHFDAQRGLFDPALAAVACDSGCDGGLPWEILFPSVASGAYAGVLAALATQTLHWGSARMFSIAPGWAELALAATGAWALFYDGRARLVTLWAGGIGLGLVLALPSHYLGIALPSFVSSLTGFAPDFQFGGQFGLVAAFFVVLFGGVGLAWILNSKAQARVLFAACACIFVFLDIVSFPARGAAGAALTAAAESLPPSAAKPVVAFYPFIMRGDGPEFESLVRAADRSGLDLINSRADATLANLSDAATRAKLASLGVRYVIVSVPEYTRRRDILRAADIFLPLDERAASASWSAPGPGELAAFRQLDVETDGTLVLALP